MKYIFITFFLFNSAVSLGDTIFYFGDSHSTGTPLGSMIQSFLKSPSSECSQVSAQSNQVFKFNGNGLDPRHWVSTGESSKRFIHKVLEKKIGRAGAGISTLDKLLIDRSANQPQKIVLEFGDNSLPGNLSKSFKSKLIAMIDRLNVGSFRDCLIIAPQPNVKSEYVAAKNYILSELRTLKAQNICQVVFFDESNGRLPLTDGIHTTFTGYKTWAKQVIESTCGLDFF